jgi:uncharacterized membrane protein (UPF0127 family)
MPQLGRPAITVVCQEAQTADRFLTRLVGLLGKRRLKPGAGLIIEPCSSIHTFGMAFPIDVVALDRQYLVLGIWKNVRPWRVKVFRRDTRRVLELASGSLGQTDIEVGDLLQID